MNQIRYSRLRRCVMRSLHMYLLAETNIIAVPVTPPVSYRVKVWYTLIRFTFTALLVHMSPHAFHINPSLRSML